MDGNQSDDTRSHDTDFAALWSPDEVTRSFAPTAAGPPVDLPFLFSPNQRFGPYVIVRPLGKGGMGQVYEADEIESGRRVAIKILSRGIADEEELERFLREGQLAASLSHPNCVYVFGTSEVQGFPVISMELVPEGTLKDRVVPDAPMGASAAVDAVLQVITGLEAAAAIGILHRDIKPSNCFVHRDGRVLVGDFGLSVAAHAPGERAGTILGTPGFASPEQLRGDPLDVRSDIYSVGATLFYLLAGRAPFEDNSTTSLIARVAAEPPPALETVRPGLPRRLALVVAKCLAKSAGERYESYASLRAALEPFGSAQLVRAPLWRRSFAGLIDNYLTSIPAVPLVAYFALQPLSPSHRLHALVVALVFVASRTLYFGFFEGVWGAAAGKALMGLRVVDAHHVTPALSRSFARALLFAVPSQLIVETITYFIVRRVPDVAIGSLDTVTGLAYVVVLFCTARPSNGYAALQDRFTGTRVVRRRARMEARASSGRVQPPAIAEIAGHVRVGPYILPAGTSACVDVPCSVIGYDDRLRRRVWIDLLPAGAAALNSLRRDLDRPARARWLAGRRDGMDCWDAYEAIDALPLRELASAPQPWSRVRHWIEDLAREMASGLSDGSLPRLHADRVWIGRDDRARLLEWSRPGTGEIEEPAGSADPSLASAQQLLYATAATALTGVPPNGVGDPGPQTPLPLAARELLLKLRRAAFSTADALLDGVARALASPAYFSRPRRAGQIAVTGGLPILLTAVSMAGVRAMNRGDGEIRQIVELKVCLDAIDSADRTLLKQADPNAEAKRSDAEIYIAEHLRSTVEDPSTWARSVPNLNSHDGKNRARHALDAHARRTSDDVRRADATVSDLIARERTGLSRLSSYAGLWSLALTICAGTFVITIILSLLGAAITGSGFTFRPFGAVLVNRRGQRASRIRAVWRAVVTYTPVYATLAAFKFQTSATDYKPGVLAAQTALMLAMLGAALWAIARPTRGLQDRLAGTWIVPR